MVGLCGGIGAGKSTVADLLAGHGARVIDVDALGREVLTHDDVRAQVAAAFGDGVLAANGSVDRAALAAEPSPTTCSPTTATRNRSPGRWRPSGTASQSPADHPPSTSAGQPSPASCTRGG